MNVLSENSVQIVNFINKNISTDQNISNYVQNKINDKIENNNFLIPIIKTIDDMTREKFEFKIKKNKVSKIHDVNQYPLIYIYYKQLYNNKILNHFFDYIPNLNDFWTFIEWFRSHHHLVKYTEIYKIIKKKNHNDLVELHDMLFNVSGNRGKIHTLLYDNQFIGIDTHQHIESCNLDYFEVESGYDKIYLYFPCNYDNNDSNICIQDDEVNKIVNEILTIINIMRNITKKKHMVDLTIFFGKQKKKMPKNNIFSAENINSGSTYPAFEVYIWRREEFRKVLIHELVHYFGCDAGIYNNGYEKLEKVINNNFKYEWLDSHNEAYTEILALIIHSCYVSKITKISLKVVLANELYFTIFQISKILKQYNNNDIFKIKFKQTTSVLSYFIVKMMLFINIESAIKFFDEYGIISKNADLFAKLVDESINKYKNDSELHSILELINTKQFEYENPINKNKDYVLSTLRMTCMEIY